MISKNSILARACWNWLNRPNLHDRAIAATLTFRPYREILTERGLRRIRLNESDAQEAVRHFLRRLDAAAFGKDAIRRGKKLNAIPIREGSSGSCGKHIHYHLQLQVPSHESLLGWKLVADREWSRMQWASPKQNILPLTDFGVCSRRLQPAFHLCHCLDESAEF